MVLPCPDISTAHAGESESILSSFPSFRVLKKSLFSLSSGVDGVYMALEIYGTFIGTSVLQAKRIYHRHFLYGVFFFFLPLYPNDGSKSLENTCSF